MTRQRILVAALLAVLTMGVFAGLAVGAPGADSTSTTIATTDPGTTTDPATTTTTPTTTTDQTVTNAAAPVDQTTTQQLAPATTTTAAPVTTTVPQADCTQGQLTCGNNVATQIAIVTQLCNAFSGNTVINVQVQSLDGKPLDAFTIDPHTTCLNVVNITQIVQQFCIGCTLVVLPPPPAPPAAPLARAMYCMPQPVVRPDGTVGRFVDLLRGQPDTDPRWAGATPATYVPGTGYTCTDGSGGQTVAPLSGPPTFTLTVPAAFIGQYLNLCIQPASPALKPSCHAVRIDDGATVTIPVSANVSASVSTTTGVKGAKKTITTPKTTKQITGASSAYAGTVDKRHTPKVKHHTVKHHTVKHQAGQKHAVRFATGALRQVGP